MSTPRASLPSLRAFLGSIACRKTPTASAVRGLYSLQGALTESDTDVQSVVNALIASVDSLPGASTSTSYGCRTVDAVTPVILAEWTPPHSLADEWLANLRISFTMRGIAGATDNLMDGIELCGPLKCFGGVLSIESAPSTSFLVTESNGDNPYVFDGAATTAQYKSAIAFSIVSGKLRITVTGWDASTIVWSADVRCETTYQSGA